MGDMDLKCNNEKTKDMSDKFMNKYRIPSNRLHGWDYASKGCYFITMVTANREEWFGEVRVVEAHVRFKIPGMVGKSRVVETHGRASLQKGNTERNTVNRSVGHRIWETVRFSLLVAVFLLFGGAASAQSYKIGDVYIAPDGSRGIVYYLHPDGSGGWVVALNDASTGCTWGASNDVSGLANQNPSYYPQLLNDTTGYANTQTLRNYQNNSTTYAAGKVDFAHGWVLPSPAQLSMLYGQLPFIASAITGAGGTALGYNQYWCSAENSASNAWCVDFGTNSYSGQFAYVAKTTSCRVRAVRSFSNTAVVYDTSLTYQWNTGSTQPYINVSPSQTTTYTVTGTTEYGCSTTAEQTIIVGTGSSQTIYDTVCRGAGYEANGFGLTEAETDAAGTLTRTRTLETEGCSSTLTLQLMVKSPVASTSSATAYGSYIWNGVTYYESGDYTQTFTAANGCDSIVTLHLTIHYGSHNMQTESACDSFTWHGTTYTQSGTYTYEYTNAAGCESTDTLHLTISPADSAEFAETECESYTWNGTTYVESGDYTQTLTNAAGCDSVVTLHLTITPLPTLSHTPDTVIHAGDSAHLWASGADVLYWTDTDGNILAAGSSLTVNPANPTMYYLTGQNYSAAMGNNLVVNGDFEQGNIGFNSAYTYVTNYMAWGSYAITTNALWAWGENGQPLYGHGGTGLYMLVDGATTPNFMAWQETVPVTPNTYYAFSTQVASTGSSYDFALLQFSINGTQLGPIFHSPNVLNTWQPFYEVWYSGNNTSATLTILNQNTTTYGNDFGLDDIVFAPLSDCSVIDSVWVSVYNDATIDQRTICENELPYEWNGVLFEHADTVEVVLPSSTGADSTVVMHLTINYGTHNSDTVTACGSHKWHGTTYTMSGIYTYSYANAAGCESTDTLHLTVSSADYAVATEIACEEYEWEGVTYAESGIYTQTLTNASGCDSTVTLHLTIHHGTHNVQTDTACNSYEWHDVTYTTSGTYTYAYMNADSCPSVDTLHLTINYADSAEFTAIACEEYEWGGTVYTETGDYTRILTNASGCDSTVTLHLTIRHGTHNVQTDTACNSYEWHDVTYTTSGIYTYAYMNAGSTVTLHLTIHHGTHTVQTDTACNSYEWHDVTYITSGIYTYSYMNADSCPSVDTLHLTVQPCDVSVIIDSVVCANALPLVWNGMVFTQADTQVVVIPASNGADSIVTMVLHVNLLTDSTIHADVLQNNLPYILNNTPYNTPGTYVQHLTNAAGCDSTLTLVLTVLYNSTTQMDTTLCASALPFTWNDSVFTAAGTKTRIYSASNGADSLVVMTLSLFPQPEAVVTGPTVICDGAPVILTANSAQSYLWSTGATTQSVTVSQEGHYTLLVTNEFGCSDTTFHNVFELLNPIVDAHVSEMCAGGSYLVTVGYQQESNIQLGHGETTLSVADTIFLPDGIYCEPFGCSYQSPVTFTAYADGDTIQSADDIYYVRLNIEHSFIGDLYINITCPNGQKADLLKYGGTGSSECNSQIAPSSRGWMSGDNMSVVNHLGVIHPGSSSSCDPSAYGNEPGTGWNYCWSNNTTQGYTYASGAGGYIYRAGNEHNTIVDSSNVAAGTQFYHPDDSFTSLIGCPLNGSWYIEVQDGWSVDNGYLFGWELALSTDMLPQRNFILENATADGPWITNVSDSLFRIEPPADLAHDTVISYTFTVYDTSGCSYDTTISITFHALPRMEMDTTVCGSLEWNGDVYTESGQYEWTYPTDHCDSTFVLNLTIAEPFESTLEDVICEGDGYNANGFVVNPIETVGLEELHRELNLQTQYGCDSIVHLTLTVIDTALLIVPLTEDFCESQSMELMVVTPMPDYIWSTGESAPTITVTTPGYYSVTATQGDCSATARVLVQGCTYGFYLPNAITPSRGDGLNDYFCIPEAYLDNIALFEISIVNRWGEQVYYSTDKHFKWNGEYRGSIQYQTIYNYVIRYTDTSGRPYTRTGAVTVL